MEFMNNKTKVEITPVIAAQNHASNKHIDASRLSKICWKYKIDLEIIFQRTYAFYHRQIN